MVFGNTYCAISHLHIKDGEKCILIPLGFSMQHEFDYYNTASINCFAYLHTIVGPAIEVIFGGNVSVIKYCNDSKLHKKGSEYNEHEMFMLVHHGFYKKLLTEFNPAYLNNHDRLPLDNSTRIIWQKANEINKQEQATLRGKLNKKEISNDEYVKLSFNIPTPEWLKNLFQVAIFMGNMGIPVHPVWCNDQHQRGDMYEKIRATFAPKIKAKKSK